MTSFFKSLIMSGQNVPPNRIKRLSMSGRLPSCHSKQIYDVKVIYTPFLRSKMKIVWKNMRDIKVSQFDFSLWTSPRARYLHKLNSFDFYCKPGTWWTKNIFWVFRLLSSFCQGGHFYKNSSKIAIKNERIFFKTTSFFKSQIMSDPNELWNKTKHPNMSSRLPSCN